MSASSIIMYQSQDGKTKIDVTFEDDTVWLSLDQIAELFNRDKSTISRHIKNIFEEGELLKDSTVANFATVQNEGSREVSRQIDFYNLDVIISVGYRVKSLRGTHFRIWANQVLKEYLKKGFAINDDLLKNMGGGNYFDELLSRIRDIRSSEKVFYRKVLEIYALSIDYDQKSSESKTFFATVQNKIHFSTHGHTAAELIHGRADGDKDFMGLTTWSGVFPQKADSEVAKNYLTEAEIDTLNRIVALFLDFAELQAKEEIPLYMKDWLEALDGFLKLSRRELLEGAGKISAHVAKIKAHKEYDKFRERTKNNISEVEKHFLESLKHIEKLAEEKK